MSFTARIVVAIVSLLCASLAAGAERRWVGEYRIGDEAVALVVNERPSTADGGSTIDLPAAGHFGVPAPDVALADGALDFTLALGPQRLRFTGRSDAGSARGEVAHGDARGRFELVEVLPPDHAALARLAGSYRIDDARVIDVAPMDEAGGQLAFIDHGTRRIGVLQALAPLRFAAGPTLGVPYPFAIEAGFVAGDGGGVESLRWRDGTRRFVAARISTPRIEPVQLRRGGITLAGDLWLPDGPGPHPAVVFAHGSGDAGRNVGVWNAWFVRQGIAVLSFDKRGVGGSGGDWRSATLDEIAGDWLAGVEWLRTRADIDARRIGVHGSSQGGWTAPRMAARDPALAFLIVRAGSGVDVLETMAWEVGWSVREAGFDAVQGVAAEAAARELFELAARRADWPTFSAAAARHRDAPWAAHAWPLQMSEDGWGRGWVALNAHYDNADDLAQAKLPVLWYLGEHDHNVPSARSAKALRRALRRAGNDDATIVMLDDAGHGFTETTTGSNREFALQSKMAAGYWDTMGAWLRARGFASPAH